MLLCSALSRDGLIIDQSQLKTIPYGKYTSDYNGCGWIATYNAMKLLGEEADVEEVLHYLNKYTILEGRFGTNPFGIKRYFEKHDYDFRYAFLSRRLEAKKNAVGILLYTDGRNIHYVAFQRENRKFHFYNDIYGREDDIRTLDEFLQGKRLPLWYLILE
jgi:hypothetical protein